MILVKWGEFMDYKLMGQRIREHRKKKGLTQEQLAELIDISPSFMGPIERGSRISSLDTVMRLCEVLEVMPNELLTDMQMLKAEQPEFITISPKKFMQEMALVLFRSENP